MKKYHEIKKEHIKQRIKHHNFVLDFILFGIAIIAISIGLAYTNAIPLTATAKENIAKHEILEKMREIDDIAHQQREKIKDKLGSGYNQERDKIFTITDYLYHTAQQQEKKLQAAERLNNLIIEQNILLQQIGQADEKQIQKCETLEKEIHQQIKE